MSAIFTAAQHAAAALRRIGAFATTHAGADPDQVEVVLISLDKLVAELAGTERLWWLVPADVQVPLTAGVNPTNIVTAAGIGAIPADSLQFITDAKLINISATPTGQEDWLRRVSRHEFAELDKRNLAGTPEVIYIDRTLLQPMAYLHPVQGDSTRSLLLTIQKFHPDVSENKNRMQIDQAWNRWCEYALAADIGSGPVLNLDAQRITGYRNEAAISRNRLLSFQNRESVRDPFTRFRDF